MTIEIETMNKHLDTTGDFWDALNLAANELGMSESDLLALYDDNV